MTNFILISGRERRERMKGRKARGPRVSYILFRDHDDESQCVVDAVSSLNQIKGGLKVGRLFSQS